MARRSTLDPRREGGTVVVDRTRVGVGESLMTSEGATAAAPVFEGGVVLTRSIADLTLIRLDAEQGSWSNRELAPSHALAVLTLHGWTVLEGEGSGTDAAGLSFVLQPGQLGVTGPRAQARVVAPKPVQLLLFKLSPRALPDPTAIEASRVGLAHVVHDLALSAWTQAPALKGDSAALVAETVQHLVEKALADERQTAPEFWHAPDLEQIQRFVAARLDDPDLSPKSVAAALQISVRTLHARFERHGTTLGEWIREQRLTRCDAELVSPKYGDRRISDICYRWGFSDLAHFGRLYKMRFGASPRERRRAALAQAVSLATERRAGGNTRKRRQMNREQLASLLYAARTGGPLIGPLPSDQLPRSVEEAYSIADLLVQRLGRPITGYKIGATSPKLLAMFNIAEPFVGRILGNVIYESGSTVAAGDGVFGTEAEFAFRIARDLPDGIADGAAMAAAVEACYPALELNRPSYLEPFKMGGLALIADNGVNAGVVLGAPLAAWPRVDLAQARVSVRHNGEPKGSGEGTDVLGHPLSTLVWLANDRARRGEPLQAGQVVVSGSMGPLVNARAGDAVEADFGEFGCVRVDYVR